MRLAHLLRGFGLAAVWLLVSVGAGTALFLGSERTAVVASHDSVLRPTFDGRVVVRTGPVLPDVRLDSGGRLGVELTLGKTNAETMGELVERYAVMASYPEGSVAKVEQAVADMARDAALRGAVIGLVPVVVWLLLGRSRRAELVAGLRSPRGAAAVTALALAGVLLWEPWQSEEATVEAETGWIPLTEFLGDDVRVPEQVAGVEVLSDQGAIDSRRLVASALSTYRNSRAFYDKAAAGAADLELRQPEEGETVAVLVSDRHDNIGMDPVARAIGDNVGATALLDAGDDTSTGQRWEAFSLDSVTAAFEDYDRFGVPGNHDHGDFVSDYLSDRDWTVLSGEVVEGPGGGPLTGLDDPRSSGLGSWRDETGLSFSEVGDRFSEEICAAEERVATVLVHDSDLAQDALERGCVDLVLGGHVHVKVGPTRIVAENGEVGYTYTTGTTGGAAYAIAVGSKPRRDAMITLLTYGEDGRPVGVQPVTLQTNGSFVVADFVPLDYS